jgi:hypothetical protein
MDEDKRKAGAGFRSSAASTLKQRQAELQGTQAASTSGRVTTHTRRVVYQAAKPQPQRRRATVSAAQPAAAPAADRPWRDLSEPKRPRRDGGADRVVARDDGQGAGGRGKAPREGTISAQAFLERSATGPGLWWPPPACLVAAPLTFRTVADYQAVFEPLFLEETREGLRSGAQRRRHQPLGFRRLGVWTGVWTGG